MRNGKAGEEPIITRCDSEIADPEVRALLDDERYACLRRYVVTNGFRRFYVYYASGTSRAAFVAPEAVVIDAQERYDRVTYVIQDDPWSLTDGRLGVRVSHDGGETETYSADNINRLLVQGERMAFVNDFEGIVTLEGLAEVSRADNIAARSLFAELVKAEYCAKNGALTSRQRRDIEEKGLIRFNWKRFGLIDAGAVAHAQARLQGAIMGCLRADNPIAACYTTPAGLFNYDDSLIRFEPHLGRGEHTVYFNFLVGNRYGSFSPYSFIDVMGDIESSKRVYAGLIDAGVIDRRGTLAEPEAVDDAGFDFIADADRRAGVRDIVRAARPLTLDDARRDIAESRERVTADLRRLRELSSAYEYTVASFSRFVDRLAGQRARAYLERYQGFRIVQEVADEIVKNRGIVLRDGAGDALLLLTDSVERSSPHYARLLAFFRGRLPDAKRISIAFAYTNPPARVKRDMLHPAVQALHVMAQEEE
ncbi:MAG TPA: hypothetical protein PKM65_08240 [Spirochaetota bacterium]|nr:hypothetical protein [Spirochaetota bacterium]HNT09648.1 hypothetical protein [Spirochaetota bacterium]